MTLTTSQLTKPLRVSKRIQETSDTVSLELEVPSELSQSFRYEAGQFVTFFMKINGEDVRRSYSLSSTPDVDQGFRITVKKVPGGKGSNFLCDKIKEGDVLATTPPAGVFFKKSHLEQKAHFVLVGAGSGITPLFSILKRVLTTSPENQVTFIDCNRDESSIIFKDAIAKLQTEFSNQLEVVHVLSNPSSQWTGARGRVSTEVIKKALESSAKKPNRQFYSCGPSGFMATVRSSLLEIGVSKDHIHEESFGDQLPAQHAKNPAWTYIGPGVADGEPQKIIASIDGETVEVEVKKGLTILENLMEAGASPPYSCMAGACMACMGKVLEGQVYQEDPGILVEENIEKHEALTCQAKPLSRVVKVSYDNL